MHEDHERTLIGRGILHAPGSLQYAESRTVFNGYIDAHPAFVVCPEDDLDISHAIRFASERSLRVSIRNGGHSAYGYSVGDDCVVLDLRHLNQIVTDAEQQTVRIGGGVLSGALDNATAPYGLALPLGDCPGVGVAGIALGGGNGFLSRMYGLTCDSLLGCTLIDADGTATQVNAETHPELLRALRGGGQGNFGVISNLAFRLHTVPELVTTGSIFLPMEDGVNVLMRFQELMQNAPPELNLFIRLNREFNHLPAIRIYGVYLGAAAAGRAYFTEICNWSKPYFAEIRESTYYAAQSLNASSISPNIAFHWKNAMLDQPMTSDFCASLISCFAACPNDLGRINLDPMGGAIATFPEAESVFTHRRMHYILSIIGVWQGEDDQARYRQWVDSVYGSLARHCHPVARYTNYVDPQSGPEAYYGDHVDHLQALRRKWDPGKQFLGLLDKTPTTFEPE